MMLVIDPVTDQQDNISVMDRAPNITGYDRITVDPGQMGGQPCVRRCD